ncbi:MAG: peptidase S1, partial [Moraxellaceae bacterium]
SGSAKGWKHFPINVAAGSSALNVTMSGGSGDADLYVRSGSEPSTATYNCRPYKQGNNETCAISNPAAGTWYVSIYGYSAYSGVSLKATAP